jgi:hypothetical protein
VSAQAKQIKLRRDWCSVVGKTISEPLGSNQQSKKQKEKA